MKKRDDIEELDDEILDEVVDEDIEDIEEIEDEPKPKSKNRIKTDKNVNVKNDKKGKNKVKVAVISSSVAVGVIAIALVALFVILPALGINIFSKKAATYDGPTFTKEPYCDFTTSYGLYFYGDDHEPYNTDMTDVDMVRASESLAKKYFDPSKPTIIWFHGWESTGSVGDRYLMAGADTRKVMSSYDCNYAHELKEKGYNVGTFQFQGVEDGDTNYAKSLGVIYKYVVESFNKTDYSLSFLFASEIIKVFGESYAKDITFAGHSCGGFVSTATNYMLQVFYHAGKITNKNLIAKRMIVQDPYVDTLGDGLAANAMLMGTNELIGDRRKSAVVQDMMIKLHKFDNVAIDVYLGMSGASDEFINPDKSHFNEVLPHVVITDMTGLKKWQGNIGNIHVLTRDWCWRSILENKLKDQDGNLAPSGACTNEEILSMVGNLYQQQNAKWDFATESLQKVSDTSGFKF